MKIIQNGFAHQILWELVWAQEEERHGYFNPAGMLIPGQI